MSNQRYTSIDVRRLIFPLIAGHTIESGFSRARLAGTGFFVGSHGLALTAGHVIRSIAEGYEVRAALPGAGKPMGAFKITWAVYLPDSDIAVMRVEVSESACFATSFSALPLGVDVQTTGIPEHMLENERGGRTQILMRCLKGYVSHGNVASIDASFPLPKGMSGAPIIADIDYSQFVVGVFVGQSRGEMIEDQVEESVSVSATERRVQTDRTSRVEYFAKSDLLEPYRHFSGVPAFEGFTLEELISKDRETRGGTATTV
jgi:hypothetical protein